jgi:hypothetical protein
MPRNPITSSTVQLTDSSTPYSISKITTHDAIINFYNDYISIPCSAIFQNDLKKWHMLTINNKQRPYHFELFYGKADEREQYFQKSLRQVAATRQPTLPTTPNTPPPSKKCRPSSARNFPDPVRNLQFF